MTKQGNAFEQLSKVANAAGRCKVARESEERKEDEDEGEYFEFSEPVGTSDGRRQRTVVRDSLQATDGVQGPPPNAVQPRYNSRPPITHCPFQQPSEQHVLTQADQWVQEYNAERAYEGRLKESEDSERMAEAAGDLLSKLDLTDEKLRNSRFVGYLMQLAGRHYSELRGPTSTQQELERSDYESWREMYRESIQPILCNEDYEWDKVEKDWESYEANGLGYEGFAAREFVYVFSNSGPGSAMLASEHQSRGRIREAILEYEGLVNTNDQDSEAWLQLGYLQMENEQDMQAIAAFHRALALDPTAINAWMAMAGCLVNERCVPEALDALQSWVRHHRVYQVDLHKIDASLRNEECLRCFRELMVGNSEDPDLHTAMSILYSISTDHAQGMTSIQRAVALSPNNAQSLILRNRMGAMMSNAGLFSEALTTYNQLLKERPQMARAHYNLGISLFNSGDYRAAVRSFVSALQHQLIPPDTGSTRRDVYEGVWHVWDMLRLTCELIGDDELVLAALERDLQAFL